MQGNPDPSRGPNSLLSSQKRDQIPWLQHIYWHSLRNYNKGSCKGNAEGSERKPWGVTLRNHRGAEEDATWGHQQGEVMSYHRIKHIPSLLPPYPLLLPSMRHLRGQACSSRKVGVLNRELSSLALSSQELIRSCSHQVSARKKASNVVHRKRKRHININSLLWWGSGLTPGQPAWYPDKKHFVFSGKISVFFWSTGWLSRG